MDDYVQNSSTAGSALCIYSSIPALAGGLVARKARSSAATDYESRPLYLTRGENTGGSDLSICHS